MDEGGRKDSKEGKGGRRKGINGRTWEIRTDGRESD